MFQSHIHFSCNPVIHCPCPGHTHEGGGLNKAEGPVAAITTMTASTVSGLQVATTITITAAATTTTDASSIVPSLPGRFRGRCDGCGYGIRGGFVGDGRICISPGHGHCDL